MRFYSGDGKRVAKTESGKNREKPAVRSREYIPEAEGKEKRETLPAAQSSAAKPAQDKEWRIWAEALLIFLAIMTVTVVFLHFRNAAANRAFRELAEQIQQAESMETETQPETDQPTESTILPKYAPLYEENPDFFGWIRIDGTLLDCPVMLSAEDNEKYLHKNFHGKYSVAGTPFADNRCTRDSDNILIYGHHMRDGSVFQSLMNYAKKSYWQEHPTVMFSDLYQDYEYEVLAAFYDRIYAAEETAFRYYEFVGAMSETEYDFAVSMFEDKALYDTGVEAEYGDKLITMSTCAYHVKNGRFVVVARRLE